MQRVACDSSIQYKPQFAYRTPEGYRDEVYLIPFSFSVLPNGRETLNLPVQLDDDAIYLLRGIVFPVIGTGLAAANFVPPLSFSVPGLCRIRDTNGNYLSEGLVLALGVWSQSGFASAEAPDGINAFGFPVEPEVACAPGGTLTFDFALRTNAAPASVEYSGAAATIIFVAAVYGTAGNAYSVEFIDPAAPNVPLSVAVVGSAVQVTLATDGGSAIVSTLAEVAAAVNAAETGLVWAVFSGDTAEVAAAFGPASLGGGEAAFDQATTLAGTLIGVKRFKEC